MTPERWRQVDQLLQTALTRPPDERDAFLADACAGDEDLRREVASLLRFHQPSHLENDFLAELPAALAAEVLAREDELAGRTFGYYQVERRLGQGGMGVVYLACDTRLGRPVALKLLHSKFTQDPERVRRFQQEARAASSLNHPNILTIYEVGQVAAEDGGAHFIAAEFVAGETLRAKIHDGGLHPAVAVGLAGQIATALAAAHEAGIVHRDIKPENVMVRPDGLVKVLDFGLAKLSRATSDPYQTAVSFSGGETQPGVVLGTVSYMSPEQARGERVDARTDIFSLGVVLYEMLAGRQPFVGPTFSHALVAIMEQAPPPLPHAPAALQCVINRALAKQPAERYQTAAELREEVKSLERELEFAAKFEQIDSNGPPRQTDKGDIPADVGPVETSPLPNAGHAAFAGFVRRRGRAIMLAMGALAMVSVAAWLSPHWFAARDTAINSIAVLPFLNASGDPQMEYLPDGITESVIDSLSRLPELQVMARSAVFTYKGREVDPRLVGDQLKVRAVVTGRVERQGEQLIILSELVDTSNGALLWSDRYLRPMADIFNTEEEIARKISGALRLRLSGEQLRRMGKRYTSNTEAYQLYLRGRHFYHQGTRESKQKALDYYRQVIALEPRYAPAYAGIAAIYADFSGDYLPPREAMPRAKEAVMTALALDDQLAEARLSLAVVKFWGDWDWAGADQEFKRVIELNPNLTEVSDYYSNFLICRRRFDEAWREARRAEELDPLSPPAINISKDILYFTRQYDLAIEQYRRTLEIYPNSAFTSGTHRFLGRVYCQKQMHQEAIAELQRAVELTRSAVNLSWLAYAYAMDGRKDEARKILQELKRLSARQWVSPVSIARVHLGLGNKDQAIEWLRKGYDERSDHVLNMGVDPTYDSLRTDPRFVEMLRGMGLEP